MPQTKPWDRREFLTSSPALAATLSMTSGVAQRRGDPAVSNPHTRPVRNRRDIVIYRDPFAYCSHVSIVRLANGEWLAAFNETQRIEPFTIIRTDYHHPPDDPHYHNLITRSDDEGRTWSPPQAAPNWDWYGVECPGLAQLNDGTVVLNQWQFLWYPLEEGRKRLSQGEEIWVRIGGPPWKMAQPGTDWSRSDVPWCRAQGGCYVHLSPDGGRTWGQTAKISTGPYMGGYTPRGVVQLGDGTVLMITADHTLNRTAFAVRSQDGGLSWSRPLVVANVKEGSLSEPTAAVLPGDRVVAIMRSNTGYLHQSESPDRGLTWTPVRRTPIWGSPGHLLPLSDGRLLLTYGHRRAPFGIRACLSQDGGQTWDYEKELLIRDDMPNKNLGYPVSIEYEPGRLFTIYYGEQEGDGARAVAGYGVSSIRGTYWEVA